MIVRSRCGEQQIQRVDIRWIHGFAASQSLWFPFAGNRINRDTRKWYENLVSGWSDRWNETTTEDYRIETSWWSSSYIVKYMRTIAMRDKRTQNHSKITQKYQAYEVTIARFANQTDRGMSDISNAHIGKRRGNSAFEIYAEMHLRFVSQ
jgi:hypothetical protein